MEKLTFNCCKYLNHAKGSYNGCELKSFKGLCAYWERGEMWTDGGQNPRDVQFCKKRGRLNYPTACIEGGGECSEYTNEERTVEIG